MSHRIEKINELIKQQIADIFSRELNIKPGIFLTVSKVDTSKDLRYARIFISIYPESETRYISETIKKEAYFVQGVLNKRLFIKIVPRVEFIVDKTESKADEIEKLLNQIKED